MTVALGPSVGAELLAQLGFLHVPGFPFDAGRAYLFVGLRRRPTLRHFDPERIDYWVSTGIHGLRTSLDWTTRMPHSSDFSWGLIELVDRKGISNRYLSFGGRLNADQFGPLKVAVLSSDAPILAHGGHSQDREPFSDSVASFFARLRAAAGQGTDHAARLCAASPLTLYAAFIADSVARHHKSELSGLMQPHMTSMLVREQRRLVSLSRPTWLAGLRLAEAFAGADASLVTAAGEARMIPTDSPGTA